MYVAFFLAYFFKKSGSSRFHPWPWRHTSPRSAFFFRILENVFFHSTNGGILSGWRWKTGWMQLICVYLCVPRILRNPSMTSSVAVRLYLDMWSMSLLMKKIPHPGSSPFLSFEFVFLTLTWLPLFNAAFDHDSCGFVQMHDARSYRIPTLALRLLAPVFSWPSRYSVTIVSNALTPPPESGAVSLWTSDFMRVESKDGVYTRLIRGW